MKLAPRVLSATMAVYFAAINLVKRVPYTALGLMEVRSGTWFYRLAYLGMFLTGVKLLWDGLK